MRYMPLLRMVIRRLLTSVPALALILALVFLLLKLAPGDTVDALLAQVGGGGDPAMVSALRKQYGLDLSIPAQLGTYLWHLLQFDLGTSAIYGKPVATVIFERLPPTLLLMASSLFLSLAIGIAIGCIAALKANRWPDTLISTLGLVFYATPSFWSAVMSIVVFSVGLGWLPAGGYEDIGMGLEGWARFMDISRHLVLPTVSLALISLAIYLRVMRASMMEVMTLDFIRTAKAKGLTPRALITHHALRNALLPVLTLVGLQTSALLGGSVVIESVFALPGLGRLAYESVVQRDLNTLLGIVLISALLVMLVNFLVDLAYLALDPRIVPGSNG